jgi:hypothetical protein
MSCFPMIHPVRCLAGVQQPGSTGSLYMMRSGARWRSDGGDGRASNRNVQREGWRSNAPAAALREAKLVVRSRSPGDDNRRDVGFSFAPDTGDDLVVSQGAFQRTGQCSPGNADRRRTPGFGLSVASSNCRHGRTGGESMCVVGGWDLRRQGRTPTGLQDALERLCRSGP